MAQTAPASPPQWWEGPAPAAGDDAPPARGSALPTKHELEHVKVALELVLLVAAVPYLLKLFTTSPRRFSQRAAEHHLGG